MYLLYVCVRVCACVSNNMMPNHQEEIKDMS